MLGTTPRSTARQRMSPHPAQPMKKTNKYPLFSSFNEISTIFLFIHLLLWIDCYEILLRRSMKVMVHELGHMFGLDHCAYFHCLMNGSGRIFFTLSLFFSLPSATLFFCFVSHSSPFYPLLFFSFCPRPSQHGVYFHCLMNGLVYAIFSIFISLPLPPA